MLCATSKASDQPAQSDQSLCLSLEYSMIVKLLTEAAQARLSLHLSKCHIVGNHMLRLICFFITHSVTCSVELISPSATN